MKLKLRDMSEGEGIGLRMGTIGHKFVPWIDLVMANRSASGDSKSRRGGVGGLNDHKEILKLRAQSKPNSDLDPGFDCPLF